MDKFGFLAEILNDSFDYEPENDPIFLTQRTPEREVENVGDKTYDEVSDLLKLMKPEGIEDGGSSVQNDPDSMALVPVNAVEVYKPKTENISSDEDEDELVQKVCNSNYVQHVEFVNGKMKVYQPDFSQYAKDYEDEQRQLEKERELQQARRRMLNDPELKWSPEQLEALKKKRDRIFGTPVSEEEVDDKCRKKNGESTDKNIRWILNMYSQWRQQRNRLPGREIIECDLEDETTITKDSLIFAMCRFLCEVRKQEGTQFPPKTLRYLVIMTQVHLETFGIKWKLIDGPEFAKINYCLDNRMKENAKLGLGREIKSAEALEVDDIEKLWESGLLGDSNPSQLLDTVLFLVGVNCALRAAREHKMLRRPGFDSQFKIVVEDGVEGIRYTEDLSTKSNQGGLKHCNVTAKSFTMYPALNTARCPVRIVKKYLSLLPVTNKNKDFYLQACTPKQVLKSGKWFRDRPVGINTIAKTVKRLTRDCNLDGYFTNHSLRHTCGSILYNQKVKLPDQSIAERTGHRSNAIEKYRHAGKALKRKVSRLLTDPTSTVVNDTEIKSNGQDEVKKMKLDITVNIKQ